MIENSCSNARDIVKFLKEKAADFCASKEILELISMYSKMSRTNRDGLMMIVCEIYQDIGYNEAHRVLLLNGIGHFSIDRRAVDLRMFLSHKYCPVFQILILFYSIISFSSYERLRCYRTVWRIGPARRCAVRPRRLGAPRAARGFDRIRRAQKIAHAGRASLLTV